MDLATLTSQLRALGEEALPRIAAATDLAALDELDVAYLGRKGGALSGLMRGIGQLPAEDRPRVGVVVNDVREAVEGALGRARERAAEAALVARLAAETTDVTTPGRPISRGSLHPINETIGRIAEIFGQFGFVTYEGPEVESDATNFQMLNIPPDHPARDLWDTMYVDIEGGLLRTHTSPGQIRVMHAERPPIRALLPGRCFRYEAVDASHASEFFQVEGLMVDEGTSLADLRGLLDEFAHAMFGEGTATRFRPGYYPFTEPSVAFDIGCLVCGGAGCPACGRTGWMTILGAGMVHPVVLQYGGIDPERYQGFAFGMGVERIAMLRHGIGDVRIFLDNDLRFLEQFPVRVPLGWLRDYVDLDLAPEALAERLTLLGFEVKGLERWGVEWRNVVVGELLTVEKHPRADRLSLTSVRVGDGEPLQIVCGATNIAPGQRVPVALPGALLPGNRAIERTEKMGVVSNGMLCSGDELRMSVDGEGILILPPGTPIGTPLADLYGDWVLDVDVKPNRGDALCLVGLAREVAAATGGVARFPEVTLREDGPSIGDLLAVRVEDPELCPRFVGRRVNGVRVAPSPDDIQRRLLAAGMRPVSNVVDATNYVLLELGKPTHAFDAGAVAPDAHGRAGIVVRTARPGERVETLDHVERALTAETLIIADANGPIGIAGVMGGAASEVGAATTDVIVESAVFDPVSVRRTAFRYALRSEASLRFEKGQESRLARIGADRVAELIASWAGGSVAAGRIDTAPNEPAPARVGYRPARVNRLLGTSLDAGAQASLLARVGIVSEPARDGSAVIIAAGTQPRSVAVTPGEARDAIVPTWRRDLLVEADVAEEIARLVGYETVEGKTPDTSMPHVRANPLELRDAVRHALVGAGLTEVVTPALVPAGQDGALGWPVRAADGVPADAATDGPSVVVTNPLSERHAVLRRGLAGSLLDVLALNERHGRGDVAIFEVGKGYARTSDGRAAEWWRLGFLLTGSAGAPSWTRPRRDYDLDDAKGAVELVARVLGMAEPGYAPHLDGAPLHPGRAVEVTVEGALSGLVGELHPAVLAGWDLRAERVLVGELAISGLAAGQLVPVRVTPIGRFQPLERDLALIVPEALAAADVAATLRATGGETLRGVTLFDIYRGAPLAAGEKSLAWRVVFAAGERALTDEEADAEVARLVAAVASAHGARLRT